MAKFYLQEHGKQHAHIQGSWRTKCLHVVFHSRHFTIRPSHHAPTALVDVELETKLKLHA